MTATAQASDAPASTRRAGIALTIIVTCQLIVVLDSTVVNIAIAQIHASLHFSTVGLSWVINAYNLTFGGLMLLGGRAGDIFGRRRLLVAGLVVFTAASLVGGLAISPAMLIAARAVFSAVSAGAGSLGLILGGVLTAEFSWRWVLFINVPIGLAVIVLAPLFVPESPRREGHVDLHGAVLSTTGLTLLIYGFIRIGEGGSSVEVIAGLFVAAVALLSLFVFVEAHNAAPLMPLHLIVNRARGFLYLVMLSISAVVFGMFFFISQYAQAALHYSALRTGLAFLPLTIAVFALSRVMPRVLARTGPRLPLHCGTALIAISLAWLSRTTAAHGYLGGLFGPLLLFGIGIGLSYVPLGATILKGVDRDDTGSASGMYQAMQQIGGSVGLAILVSIAVGHGQSGALEGAAGFALLAFLLTAAALSGRAAHRREISPSDMDAASSLAQSGSSRGVGGQPNNHWN